MKESLCTLPKCKHLDKLQAENKLLKESYDQIFQKYIPVDKLDIANDELIDLLEHMWTEIGKAYIDKE